MAESTWWPESEGEVPFDSAARAWLRRRIRDTLFQPDPNHLGALLAPDGVSWTLDVVDWLLDWYGERPLDYVQWRDSDEYRGDGWANGAWVLDEARIKTDFPVGETVVERRLDAEKCSSLDEWLRADMQGALFYRGDPGGMGQVAPDVRKRVTAAAKRRPRRKTCACGTVFVADRYNARKCDRCRELARRERGSRPDSGK